MAPILPETPTSSQSTTVKRILTRSFTIPRIRTEGFTPPNLGHWLMLPPEFDVVMDEEPHRVSRVILEVMRQTIGRSGDGVSGRKEWAVISAGHLARKGAMHRPDAVKALKRAVEAGYLLRRKCGRGYEYAVRWKTCTDEPSCTDEH